MESYRAKKEAALQGGGEGQSTQKEEEIENIYAVAEEVRIVIAYVFIAIQFEGRIIHRAKIGPF